MPLKCQICEGRLYKVLSLGYLPPPNEMPRIGSERGPQTWLPTELAFCRTCELVQLVNVPPREVSFPQDYPYTSGATPALRRNFEKLVEGVREVIDLRKDDLVVDIGSNDGTLLSCFDEGQNVLGVEPTNVAEVAVAKGINTVKHFFDEASARWLRDKHGPAKVITCTNCFAHMPDIHNIVRGIKHLLDNNGVFISESHYVMDLVKTRQYDTIYAEHLRYYSIRSLDNIFQAHGLGIFRVEHILTHGGSIRVFARRGDFRASIFTAGEPTGEDFARQLAHFAADVRQSKVALLHHLTVLRQHHKSVVGIGAPSRASTVINYCRLDRSLIDYVVEQSDSLKLGRFMPGTEIPVVDESVLYAEQPEAAILFSWHLADELIPKLRSKGYRGEIILPCSPTITNESAKAVA